MNATDLLVSVRSADEAIDALAGGAAIIDVKEPQHGSLGRADDEVVRAVVEVVGNARPVSAALGEWVDHAGAVPSAKLSYVKWGLAGCQQRDWKSALLEQARRLGRPSTVFVAYADWQCAQAPSVDEVFDAARLGPPGETVLLVDTHCKDGRTRPTLLDWLPVAWIEDLRQRCRQFRIRLALAGSLGPREIQALLHVRPDWFAVRGAVCDGQDRTASVHTDKVRALVNLLRHPFV